MAECKTHRHTIYNICSEIACPIQNILDILLFLCRKKVNIQIDPARYREPENPVLFASALRLTTEFGWKPEVTLEDGLFKTLEYWRTRYGRGDI